MPKKFRDLFIVILIIGLLFILAIISFITYNFKNNENNKHDDNNVITTLKTNTPQNTTTLKENFNVLKSELPSKLNTYFHYWNYDEIYEHYFTMGKDETLINDIDKYKCIKIINNKLMWNINNSWVYDEIIKEDIRFFDIEINMLSSSKIVILTVDNKLYYINIDNMLADLMGDGFKIDTIESLTYAYYKNMDYKEVDFNYQINKITIKTFCECECWDSYYLESNNKIYILSSGIVHDLNEYFADDDLFSLEIKCVQLPYTNIKIETNGIVSNVKDKDGNNLKIKHYIMVDDVNANGSIYNIIIDNDDKLYSFSDNKIQNNIRLDFIDTVSDFEYERFDNGKEKIILKLSNGSVLYLGRN